MKSIRAVYAVYGEMINFLEARRSIESLRKIHPDALVECFTTAEGAQNFADTDINVIISEVHPRQSPWHDPNFKVTAIHRAADSPFIFFDNDTYVAGSLQDAWSMLFKHDLMGVLAPNTDSRIVLGYEKLSEDLQVSDAFSEINSGVLFINTTDTTLSVLNRWNELLNIRTTELGDQWRLRIAMYENQPKLCILPNNYNYRLAAQQPVFGSVRVFHGHHDNLQRIVDAVNAKTDYRFPFKVGSG